MVRQSTKQICLNYSTTLMSITLQRTAEILDHPLLVLSAEISVHPLSAFCPIALLPPSGASACMSPAAIEAAMSPVYQSTVLPGKVTPSSQSNNSPALSSLGQQLYKTLCLESTMN